MELFHREKYLKKIRAFYHDPEIIKVITGIRRCGKSCLMQQIAYEIKASGVPQDRIHYFDLDSRKYRKIKTPDDLEGLLDSIEETGEIQYLFIDEIRNVKDFEEVINAFRVDGHYSIFITGSNSYLLSGELATKLTGRYIEFEMFPLTFDEYLDIKKFYKKEINPNLIIELNNYQLEGGFPKAIQYETLADKRTYVKSVINEIFEKDIRKHNKIGNTKTFFSTLNFIINNFGCTYSIRSLQDALEKSGISIERKTLNRYVDLLVDSKILYRCDRFDMKSKKSISGEKKYYIADTSIYFSTNTDNRINYGPALENTVYLYAKSLDYSVSIGRIGKLECDFILRDNELGYSYVQVAYTINESRQTEDKEYASLEKIKDNYPKYVVTTDYILQKRNGIHHVNIMEFMKEHQKF